MSEVLDDTGLEDQIRYNRMRMQRSRRISEFFDRVEIIEYAGSSRRKEYAPLTRESLGEYDTFKTDDGVMFCDPPLRDISRDFGEAEYVNIRKLQQSRTGGEA